MTIKLAWLTLAVVFGTAACSSTTGEASGPTLSSAASATSHDRPASTAPLTPSQTSSPEVATTSRPLDAMPPPALDGATLVAFRRPVRALRTDGKALYAYGLPFTAIRFDPATGQTIELPLGSQFGDQSGQWRGTAVLAGRMAVHVINQDGTGERLLLADFEHRAVSPVDISTGGPKVVASPPGHTEAFVTTDRGGRIAPMKLDDMAVGTLREVPGAVALRFTVVRGGSVWAVDPPSAAVYELDARNLTVKRRIPVATNPGYLEVDGDTIWVGHPQGATISRIDAVSGKVISETELIEDASIVSTFTPAIVPIGGRVFARLRVQHAGEAYGIIAELDRSTGRLLSWRSPGRDIYSLISFGDHLLALDDQNRVIDIDLTAFDDPTTRPWEAPPAWVFEPNGDERAAMDSFDAVYDLHGDPATVMGGIDDVRGLETFIPGALGAARAAGVDDVVPVAAIVDGDEAWVSWNALDAAGALVLEDSVAALRRHQGVWKVRRVHLCRDLAALGVPCPPL
jgi:hypothetical protein